MLKINVKHVVGVAGIAAVTLIGEALVKTVVKPLKEKIKSRENKAMVNIDGVNYEGIVEGA